MSKQLIIRIALRLLPVGTLFLPLGTLSINLIINKTTSYNIVELVKSLFSDSGGTELLLKLMETESMATSRAWMVVTAAGLALSLLAILAGLALAYFDQIKLLGASAAVYGAGTLSGAAAVFGFAMFGTELAAAVNNIATAMVNIGAYVLVAAMLLNLLADLAQWRGEKEKARLAALAKKQRKKR